MLGQVTAIDVRLGELRDHGVDTSRLWFRPRAGAGSQVHLAVWLTYPQLLDAWKSIQDKYDFKIVWTTQADVIDKDEDAIIADEMSLYQNAIAKGLRFDFNEVGNEQYLQNKFPGMTVERYLQVVQRYEDELAATGKPVLVQIAPQGKYDVTASSPDWQKKQEAHYVDWNQKVYEFVADRPNHDYLPNIHVYAVNNAFRWALIAEAREAFGRDRIICTEYGSRDDVGADEGNAQLERELAGIMVTHFRAPDVIMSHMFWNNYTTSEGLPTAAGLAQAWYHGTTVTPKGTALLDFFFRYPSIRTD
jgi:hypothetical protein